LRAARGDRSIEALSKELDVNKNTLGDYERGVRYPEVDFLVKFAEVTGANLGRLLSLRLMGVGAGARDDAILTALAFTARGNPELWRRATEEAGLSIPLAQAGFHQTSAGYAIASDEESMTDYVLLKRRGLLGSSGGGSENVVLEPKGAVAFRRDWLTRKGVTNPGALIVADIQGDSMEPTLFHGDIVVFNGQPRDVIDGVFLFCLGDRLFVKRLQYKPSGVIEVISDNRTKYLRSSSPRRTSTRSTSRSWAVLLARRRSTPMIWGILIWIASIVFATP
jgi:transcriptional regulator with XRE-family HTH domain